MKIKIVFLLIIILFSAPVSQGSEGLFSWDDLHGEFGGSGDTAVVLIHGYKPHVLSEEILRFTATRNWDDIAEALIDYPELASEIEIYSFLYLPYFVDIADLAEKLAGELEKFREEKRETIIIAHSMGGIIARHYMNYLGGEEHVIGLFTLGTPHRGVFLPLEELDFSWSPVLEDMRGTNELMERHGFPHMPGGDYLEKLNRDEKNLDKIYSFSGRFHAEEDRNFISYLGEVYYYLASGIQVPGDGVACNFGSYLPGAQNFPPVDKGDHQELFRHKEVVESVVFGVSSLILDLDYRVEGRVIDKNGQGVSGVEITMGDRKSFTDSEGYYSFSHGVFGERIRPVPKEGEAFLPSYSSVTGREEEIAFTRVEKQNVEGKADFLFTAATPEEGILMAGNVMEQEYFYQVELGKDGKFILEDVVPGQYQFALLQKERQAISFENININEENNKIEVSFFRPWID